MSMDCECAEMELMSRTLSDGFIYHYRQCPVCGRIEHYPDQFRILLDRCRGHLPRWVEDQTLVSEDDIDALMETLYVIGDLDFRKNLEDARKTPIGEREAWNRSVMCDRHNRYPEVTMGSFDPSVHHVDSIMMSRVYGHAVWQVKVMHPRNQLDRVICQIRYPAVLEIDRRIDEFQGRIRNDYPSYSRSKSIPINLADAPLPTDHVFQSVDNQWSITLSVSSLSLTTTAYTRWEEFYDRFCPIIGIMEDLFKIGKYSRVGLRYINAIRPSSLDMNDMKTVIRAPYQDILESQLGIIRSVGMKIDYELQSDIRGCSIIDTISFIDNGELGIRVDNDIFKEGSTDIFSIASLLSKMNGYSLDVFRKIVSDELYQKVVS